MTTPFSAFVGGIGAITFATLAKCRLLWFLHEETVLSGGAKVPTAEYAASLALKFYIAGGVLLALTVALLLLVSEKNRRRLAQLPRWQRFLFWPIDRHFAPRL